MYRIPDNKYNKFTIALSVLLFIISISFGIYLIFEFGESSYVNMIKYNRHVYFYDIVILCSFIICIVTTFLSIYKFIKLKGRTILLMAGLIGLYIFLMIFNLIIFFLSMSGASLGST